MRDEARREYERRQSETRRRAQERKDRERAHFESQYQERMRDWFSRREHSEQRSAYMTPFQKACELLGCGEGDSDDALRRAYRVAAKRNHPDSLRARECSETQVAEATAKMAQVNAAWELIRRERGMR